MTKKSTYIVLWLLSILGALAVLPAAYYLDLIPSTISWGKLILLVTLQSAIFYGIVCWISSILVPKTDLTPFSTKKIIFPGIFSGIGVGLSLYFLDTFVFQGSLLHVTKPPLWAGFLASFYGAINEEVLLRLFFFTAIYFLFMKFFKFEKRAPFLWVTNILVALAFGVGHLPLAFQMIDPSYMEIFRILLLNGIAGLVFGWLYWSRGLWASMIAHLVADCSYMLFLLKPNGNLAKDLKASAVSVAFI